MVSTSYLLTYHYYDYFVNDNSNVSNEQSLISSLLASFYLKIVLKDAFSPTKATAMLECLWYRFCSRLVLRSKSHTTLDIGL